MRIGLVGYGQMGMIVREQALKRGHLIPLIVDPHSEAGEVTARELTSTSPPLDVIIDFTEPQAVLGNIGRYGRLGLAAVIGTTGWYDQIERARDLVEKAGTGLIWSGNFSLGVNLFFYLVKAAGIAMNRFPAYDVLVHEYHHRRKADSPSGTAQMLGDILLAGLERKTALVDGRLDCRIEDHQLHVTSSRGGSIPGTHRVIFDSAVDTIVLEHSARSRSGFAEGAVLAAEWISGRKGFYSIEAMMQSIIGGEDHQ